MSGKNDGGDKTEKPTPKKLQDARKKGDVAKSKDVTSAVGLMIWLVLGVLTVGFAASRLAMLYDSLFATIGQGWLQTGFAGAARTIGAQSAELAITLVAMLLVPVAAVGLLTEFLQAGPVLSFEKLSPKLDSMNPVEGVKRMFSMDNLIELVKSIAKAVLLFAVGWLVIRSSLPQIVALARTPELPMTAIGGLLWSLTVKLMASSVAVFALFALLDAVYQRYSFEKKMRMSMRDIKQEMKESEGDPYIKSQRRQLAQQLAQQAQRDPGDGDHHAERQQHAGEAHHERFHLGSPRQRPQRGSVYWVRSSPGAARRRGGSATGWPMPASRCACTCSRTSCAPRITSAMMSNRSLGTISPTSARASMSRASGMLRTIGTPASSAARRIARATSSSPLAAMVGTGQVSRS